MKISNLLEEKIIFVTGCSGLIGRSVALSCLEAGAEVIGLDLKDPLIEGITWKRIDLTDISEIKSFVSEISHEKEKRIDGWVNAAYPRTKDWGDSLEELKFDSWERNVSIQMNLVCETSRLIAKTMKENKSEGSIVNLSSIYGVLAPQFDLYENIEMTMPAPYSAIKAGIINFSKYLASYYGSDNIRVNSLSPGGVFNSHEKEFVEKYSSKTMLGRMAKPEEIAYSVLFLLSDLSSYMTGQNLIVDGGWSAM